LNLKTPYENIIAEKLQQLPIPDMADAIWASIELQLDADLSSNSEDNSATEKPLDKGKGSLGTKTYLFIIVAIIAGLIWLAKVRNKRKATNTTLPNTTISTPPTNDKRDSTPPALFTPENNKGDNLITPVYKTDKKQTNDSIKKNRDTAAFIPTIMLPVKDTITLKPIPIKDTLRTIIMPPKGKGVKGITDDDYRIISGKKDSVKKKE
jgi:hypothetical protein